MDWAYCKGGCRKEGEKKSGVKTAVSRIGRARLRWEDVVIECLGKMKIHNWNKMDMDRELSIWPEQRVLILLF